MEQGSVTVIGLDDRDRWDAAAAGGLPAHGWHYAAGLAAGEGLAPRLAVVEAGGARLILSFCERSWGEATDIATLPGFAGALVTPWQADGRAALELWHAHARARGWVSGYIQLSPRNALPVPPPGDRVAAHNGLFEFDLATWRFETHVRQKVRSGLRGGDRQGARVVAGPDPRLAPAFLRLYPATMARLGGTAFAPATLETWLADPAARLIGAELGGEIVAVEFCRRRGPLAEAHVAGTAPEARGLHAWLLWKAAEVFAAEGALHFNIGGYGSAGDGLHAMKRRFGATEHPLRSLHQVYDRAAYDRLCAEAGCDPDTAYFPAYRAG